MYYICNLWSTVMSVVQNNIITVAATIRYVDNDLYVRQTIYRILWFTVIDHDYFVSLYYKIHCSAYILPHITKKEGKYMCTYLYLDSLRSGPHRLQSMAWSIIGGAIVNMGRTWCNRFEHACCDLRVLPAPMNAQRYTALRQNMQQRCTYYIVWHAEERSPATGATTSSTTNVETRGHATFLRPMIYSWAYSNTTR